MKIKDHNHKLTFSDGVYRDRPCCFCGALLEDGPTYSCDECELVFLHKPCADQFHRHQNEIHHPFHPLHHLTLRFGDGSTCGACKGFCFSLTFSCEDCNFRMHPDCDGLLLSNVKDQIHHHPLTLFRYLVTDSVCNFCHTHCDAFVFRCVQCNFNLHPQCLPSFPFTIKHKCHVDPLTLTDSVVEEDDGTGEFYCDACEKRRDKTQPVYYCAECQFIAEIGCVIDEVLPLLAVEQESDERAKEVQSTTMEDYFDASKGVEGMARSDVATATSEKVEVGFTADPALTELDEEIAELDLEAGTLEAKLEAVRAKLEALKGERVQYIESKNAELKE